MSVRVNASMFKIMRKPIELDVCNVCQLSNPEMQG